MNCRFYYINIALVLHIGTRAIYFCIIIQKQNAMNTDITLDFINAMINSDSSYKALADMIEDMDLELLGVTAA